jgi:rod shape-determining protein MreC
MKIANIKKTIIMIAVISLLIFFHNLRIITPIESIIFGSFNPLLQGFYSFSSKINSKFAKNKDQDNMKNELIMLEQKNEQLNVELAKLKSQEEENANLRRILKFEKLSKNKLILGNVISRGDFITEKESSLLTLDKGSNDGIQTGLSVVGNQGNLIGKVIETESNISKICLITNEKCKIAAAIQNQNNTLGITQGELDLTVRMNFIPMNVSIRKGDRIVTSGLEKDMPRGLLIGSISEIYAPSTELWQTAVLEPASDLNNIIFVSIIMP